MATPDLAPLPGVSYYGGTMSLADIYPTHAAVGGITTQHASLPAYGENMAKQASRQLALSTAMTGGLLGTPVAYLALAVVLLVVLAHYVKG